jgi:hypothetical protein
MAINADLVQEDVRRVAAAIACVEDGHARGKAVIAM